MKRNALNDTTLKNLTPAKAAGKKQLTDGMGLYLKLRFDHDRGHQWRFDYRRPDTKTNNTMVLGHYPLLSLAAARLEADKLRAQLEIGVDPCASKQESQAAVAAAQHAVVVADARKAKGLAPEGTLLGVAEDYHGGKMATGEWKELQGEQWIGMVKRCLPAHIALMPIADVKPMHILKDVVQPLEIAGKGPTSQAVRKYLTQVFDYAEVMELRQGNPARVIRSQTKKNIKTGNNPGVVKAADLTRVLRLITGWKDVVTRAALQVQVALFQRPGDTCAMKWADLDLDAGLWTIPVNEDDRTKLAKSLGGCDHVVPLPRQVVALLRSLHKLTGHSAHVFLSTAGTKKAITNDTLTNAMRSMGLGGIQTAHGFRATARTMLAEVLGVQPQWIECQLAHSAGLQMEDGTIIRDPNSTAYNRATFLPQRTAMVQTWADYLDELLAAPVIDQPMPAIEAAPLLLAA